MINESDTLDATRILAEADQILTGFLPAEPGDLASGIEPARDLKPNHRSLTPELRTRLEGYIRVLVRRDARVAEGLMSAQDAADGYHRRFRELYDELPSAADHEAFGRAITRV